MKVEQAKIILQATADLFDRWRYNGQYNTNGIAEALSVLSAENALFDKGGVDPEELKAARGASERLKAEKTKLARQVGAANARVTKLTKLVKGQKEDLRLAIDHITHLEIRLGETLAPPIQNPPVDLSDETS